MPARLMQTFTYVAAFVAIAFATVARAADDEGVQFFEQKIRPVLVAALL